MKGTWTFSRQIDLRCCMSQSRLQIDALKFAEISIAGVKKQTIVQETDGVRIFPITEPCIS